jgi:hypothetical protein
VLVYVDDLVITGNDNQFVGHIVNTFSARFSLKDIGLLHYFLGVEVIPTTAGLFLSQHKYFRDILENQNMAGAKDISTPYPLLNPFIYWMEQHQWTTPSIDASLTVCNTSP